MNDTAPRMNLASGLVFGFDLGTASIGYAVRRAASLPRTPDALLDSDGPFGTNSPR